TFQVATGTCAAGCRNVLGVTHCAAGEFCSKLDGTIGQCQPEPCTTKSDCTGGKLCDTNIEPHACVECVSTFDCSNNLICNQTTHTCVSSVDGGVVDAGLDASSGDASAGDSGPPPPRDAGAIDGSFADASNDGGDVNDGSLGGAGCACSTAGRPRGSF